MALRLTSTAKNAINVKVLGYGDAGVGKTVLCSTAPTPVIISAESGLLSLSGFDIPVIEVDTVEDVQDAYRFITESEDAKHFETVCLDSITEIAEVLLSKLKKDNKDPRAAYGQLFDDMGTLIRSFRDLEGKHVYFSAKMARIEDDYSGVSTFRPTMPGKSLLNGLPFFFDEVLPLRIKETTDENNVTTSYRYLQTQPDMQYVAKDRSGKLDEIEEPNLSKIFNKILAKKE